MPKNTQLESFAHTVSHDIRSPLANIGLASGILNELVGGPLDESVRPELKEMVKIVASSFEGASLLVDNILLLAEAGNRPIDVTVVDVSEVARSILEEGSALIEQKGIKVVIDEDLGFLTANRTQVYQVFSNLISNAIRHNGSKQPVVEARFLCRTAEDGNRYLVRDNGSGIPQDRLEQVFLPFFKGTIESRIIH